MGYVSRTKHIQTIIPSDVWKKLKLEAMEKGTTLQELVRRTLINYVKEKEQENG